MIEGPFDRNSKATHEGGYLNGGVGWYRKTFSLPAVARGRVAWIEFDGAYMDAEVWLNGVNLGNHPYGYTSFHYDLTPQLTLDGPNILAVRLNVQQPCSRWYSGAGIYRHVRLVLANPVHIVPGGLSFATLPEEEGPKHVLALVEVVNQGDADAMVRIDTKLFDPNGVEVPWDAGIPREVLAHASHSRERTRHKGPRVTRKGRWGY